MRLNVIFIPVNTFVLAGSGTNYLTGHLNRSNDEYIQSFFQFWLYRFDRHFADGFDRF